MGEDVIEVIEKDDAAIIFKADGTTRISLPKGDDDDTVAGNALACAAVGMHINNNEDAMDGIVKSFIDMADAFDDEDVEPKE